jgi:hypothetical protein
MKYKGIPLLPFLTAAAATAVFVTYRSSMHAARERLRGKSTVILSPSGFHYRVNGSQRGIVMDTKKTRWRWLLWSPWLAKANRSSREWQTRRPGAVIVAIKTIHTLAWFSIETCMVYLLYAGFAKRSDRSVVVAKV